MPDVIGDQINDMFDPPADDTPPPADTDPVDAEPVDAGDTGDDAGDQPPKLSELDQLRAEKARLEGRLQAIEEMGKKPPAEPEAPAEPEIIDWLGEAAITEVLEDKTKLNALLQKVYFKAREDMLRDVPQFIQQAVQRNVSSTNQAQDFYKNNPDLRPVSSLVKSTANEIYSENPNLSFADVLAQTAKIVRKKLDDVAKARGIDSGSPPPRTPRTPGGRGPTNRTNDGKLPKGYDSKNPQERQMGEMIGSLGTS